MATAFMVYNCVLLPVPHRNRKNQISHFFLSDFKWDPLFLPFPGTCLSPSQPFSPTEDRKLLIMAEEMIVLQVKNSKFY